MFGLFEDFSEQGLTHNWTLTDPQGTGTVVRDRRGGFTGTTVNTEASDLFGRGISLDGVNEYVKVENVGSSLPTGDFTLSVRVNVINQFNMTFVGMPDGSNGIEFRIHLGTVVMIGTMDNTSATGTTFIGTGRQSFTMTRIGSAIQTYINGDTEETATDGSALDFSSNCPLYFGAVSASGCSASIVTFLLGHLADIRIYNRGLSPAEVAGLATLGSV